VRWKVETGQARRIALVSDTARDVRDVMIAALLEVCPEPKPVYEPSKSRLAWRNGATAHTFAAEAPESLRGPQHDLGWADELAKWANLHKKDTDNGTAWDNLQMGLRIGASPQCLITTTPRAVDVLKKILNQPDTVVTKGSTFDNLANLSPAFVAYIKQQYEGTRLGRQELYAELLEDTEGALWHHGMIDAARVELAPESLARVVVAIDPAVTSTEQSDETGIIACGIDARTPPHGYVLEDVSGRYSPNEWANRAIRLFDRWKADRIVAEVNNGGDLVGHTIQQAARDQFRTVPFRSVHASRGKRVRAEPVAALYEQGRIHHVGGFSALEDQLCSWDSRGDERSPDRLDAMVWAFTEMILVKSAKPEIVTVDDGWQRGMWKR